MSSSTRSSSFGGTLAVLVTNDDSAAPCVAHVGKPRAPLGFTVGNFASTKSRRRLSDASLRTAMPGSTTGVTSRSAGLAGVSSIETSVRRDAPADPETVCPETVRRVNRTSARPKGRGARIELQAVRRRHALDAGGIGEVDRAEPDDVMERGARLGPRVVDRPNALRARPATRDRCTDRAAPRRCRAPPLRSRSAVPTPMPSS